MKKIWKAMLAVMVCTMLLCGCSNSKKAEEMTTEVKEESTEIKVDYSKGLNKKGMFKGIKADEIVTLCDYKNIAIPSEEMEPSEDAIDSQISSLLQEYGVYDRKVKKGDTVNIDYVGTIGGEEFAGGSASSMMLTIGSNSFIEGFEDQLIDHSPEEDAFDITATFPEDYASSEVAGKEAVFHVTVNYILPDLTDEFVEENFSESDGISTVKDFKNKVKENLKISNMNSYVWDYLLINCSFGEIPEDIMETRLDVALDALRSNYQHYMGYDDEQIINMYGVSNMDEVRETLREETENSVKTTLIASVIADKENITIDQAAEEKYLGSDNKDEFYEYYGKAYVNSKILISRISDYLIDNATVK